MFNCFLYDFLYSLSAMSKALFVNHIVFAKTLCQFCYSCLKISLMRLQQAAARSAMPSSSKQTKETSTKLKGEEEIGNLSRFWFLHCIRSGGNRDPPNLKGSRGNNMEALRHKGKYRSVRWFKFNELKPILTFISS